MRGIAQNTSFFDTRIVDKFCEFDKIRVHGKLPCQPWSKSGSNCEIHIAMRFVMVKDKASQGRIP